MIFCIFEAQTMEFRTDVFIQNVPRHMHSVSRYVHLGWIYIRYKAQRMWVDPVLKRADFSDKSSNKNEERIQNLNCVPQFLAETILQCRKCTKRFFSFLFLGSHHTL